MALRNALAVAPALAALAAGTPAPGQAQLVPEGIHSQTRGPADLCGVVGADANAVIALLRSTPTVSAEQVDSDRFEVFVARDGFVQWVVTRPGEPAHPAVTCRRLIRDAQGSLLSERQMRCDAERLPCDRLFLEFQALDEQVRAAIGRASD